MFGRIRITNVPYQVERKKTPAGKYVEGLFDIWMFVKSEMHEQPRVN